VSSPEAVAAADAAVARDTARVAARLRRSALAERRWSSFTLYVGAAILGALVVMGLTARWIAPYDPNALDLTHSLESPSWSHFMGTDTFGRDIFSRVLYALRLDIGVTLVITYVPLVIGVAIGAFAGWYGRWFDSIVMRTVDAVIAFPFLVLVIAIVAIEGPGLTGVLIGVPLVSWALYARLTRGEMLVLRQQAYIDAARVLGYSTPRIVFRHALPTLLRTNLVFSAADLVLNLLLLASLSYLGLGVQPPTSELGAMVADGQSVLTQAWWVSTLPGLTIVLLGVSFSMIGDGVADRLGRQFKLAL
jgi:peptide/nickel transport system permease protein